MAGKRTEPEAEARPQDDPGYQDAGQAGADEVNKAQAEREAAAAEAAGE